MTRSSKTKKAGHRTQPDNRAGEDGRNDADAQAAELRDIDPQDAEPASDSTREAGEEDAHTDAPGDALEDAPHDAPETGPDTPEPADSEAVQPGVETVRAFVIGHPIGHSRSPLIHRHWLEKHGLEGRYDPEDVPPEDLAGFIDRVRAGAYAGGNVTIPYKQEVRALCDVVTPVAEEIGAVNTIYVKDGAVVGTNTDHSGFLGNLDESAPGWDRNLETAIVLGAGGAARGILHALKARNVTRIHLLNRTVDRAEELAERFGDTVTPGPLDTFNDLAPGAGLVVNTTSIGLGGTRFEGFDMTRLPQSAIVTDAVYTPLMTPFLAAARDRMLKTVDGLGMLLHQAVPGFESWFGITPRVTPELRALIVADLEADAERQARVEVPDAPPSDEGPEDRAEAPDTGA